MILVRQVFQTQIGASQDVVAMLLQGAALLRRAGGSKVNGRHDRSTF